MKITINITANAAQIQLRSMQIAYSSTENDRATADHEYHHFPSMYIEKSDL